MKMQGTEHIKKNFDHTALSTSGRFSRSHNQQQDVRYRFQNPKGRRLCVHTHQRMLLLQTGPITHPIYQNKSTHFLTTHTLFTNPRKRLFQNTADKLAAKQLTLNMHLVVMQVTNRKGLSSCVHRGYVSRHASVRYQIG